MIYASSGDRLYSIHPSGEIKWFFPSNLSTALSPTMTTDGTVYLSAYTSNFEPDTAVYIIPADQQITWPLAFDAQSFVDSAPIAGSDGTAYFSNGFDRNVYAVDVDGTLKWKFKDNVADSTPAIGKSGVIYVGTEDGSLIAINADGTEKWRLPSTGSPMRSSPVVGSTETVYVGNNDGYLYAVSPDGKLEWSASTNGSIDSTPSVGPGNTVYVCSWSLYAVGAGGKSGTLDVF
jgi:outer membrane protein assembly factor BamB